MIVHSQFLVHWTGKDFHDSSPCRGPISDDVRRNYVARLVDTCRKGLFMCPGQETVHGFNNSVFHAEMTRVCFTEIRLSQAVLHAERYGMLGIGFSRDFILARGGNPVFYVQNGQQGTLNYQFAQLSRVVPPGQPLWSLLALIMGHVKPMSDPDDTDLKYYDEMEWRIAHIDQLVGVFITPEDTTRQIYRLDLTATDVKLLVFPDEDTRQLAFRDDTIKDFFADSMPSVTCLSDCEHF